MNQLVKHSKFELNYYISGYIYNNFNSFFKNMNILKSRMLEENVTNKL